MFTFIALKITEVKKVHESLQSRELYIKFMQIRRV